MGKTPRFGRFHWPAPQWLRFEPIEYHRKIPEDPANGTRTQYPALLKSQGAENSGMPYTINTLAKMAADFGVALRPVFLNMSELRTCRKPVIVHVQGASPDEGTFLLVLRLTGRRVVYMNGPSATVGTIQQDTFRRVWSGCALLPADSALTHAALCVALFFTGLGLAVAWAMARTGKVLSAAPDQAL